MTTPAEREARDAVLRCGGINWRADTNAALDAYRDAVAETVRAEGAGEAVAGQLDALAAMVREQMQGCAVHAGPHTCAYCESYQTVLNLIEYVGDTTPPRTPEVTPPFYRRDFFEVLCPDGAYVGDFELREHAEAFAADRKGFEVVASTFTRRVTLAATPEAP